MSQPDAADNRVVYCRIPSEMHDRLRALAEHDERTMSDIVRRAIRQYLDRRKTAA